MSGKKQEKALDANAPKEVARMMFRTLISTTVRIFLPVAILFGIGLAVDLNTPTKPWGMAVGVSIGSIVAIILVISQLKSIRKDTKLVSVERGDN